MKLKQLNIEIDMMMYTKKVLQGNLDKLESEIFSKQCKVMSLKYKKRT